MTGKEVEAVTSRSRGLIVQFAGVWTLGIGVPNVGQPCSETDSANQSADAK